MLPITVVIPAYQPQESLLRIVAQLREFNFHSIIIVNDGSDDAHRGVFKKLGTDDIIILQHKQNRGKGAALQTALRYWYDNLRGDTVGIVTADADGQHAPQDIANIAKQLIAAPSDLHLGVRQFSHDIPLRSRFGNLLTRTLFRVITRTHLQDTQTGLRGIPLKLIQQLESLQSVGYEYELDMLLLAIRKKFKIEQHPIQTIYLDNNESSHFNPIKDSLKIYRSLFGYLFR